MLVLGFLASKEKKYEKLVHEAVEKDSVEMSVDELIFLWDVTPYDNDFDMHDCLHKFLNFVLGWDFDKCIFDPASISKP